MVSLRVLVTERFIAMDQQFATMGLRMEQFEKRLEMSVAAVRQGLDELTLRVDHIAENVQQLISRMDRLDKSVIDLNERLDGMSEDMHQRFRVVNDRLAELAA